jgi:hypothetical protein
METQTDDAKGYRISRKPDQADDSLDSFEWEPPKESDELYEALKAAFPRGTTHRSRMRDALIDFLIQEREAEREPQRIAVPVAKNHVQSKGPARASRDNNLSQTCPRGLNSISQVSTNGGPTPPESPDGPSQACRKKKPKDWDNMTVVWTSETGLARAPRPKRTMTEEERKDYQLRRVRGACVSCKKRKRKV